MLVDELLLNILLQLDKPKEYTGTWLRKEVSRNEIEVSIRS